MRAFLLNRNSMARSGVSHVGFAVRLQTASQPRVMNRTKTPTSDLSEARVRIEAACQSLVDVGAAHWHVIDARHSIFQLETGDCYLFSEQGITRLRRCAGAAGVAEAVHMSHWPQIGNTE
jgi:hypothetical protein